MLGERHGQAAFGGQPRDIALGMAESPGRFQQPGRVGACRQGFGGGEEQPAGVQRRSQRIHQRCQVAQIDQHIAGDHHIPAPLAIHPVTQGGDGIGHGERVIDAGAGGLFDHARGKVDAGKVAGEGLHFAPHQPGTAADIQHGEAAVPVRRHQPVERPAQQTRPLIVQHLQQCLVETAGILVEQVADIRGGQAVAGRVQRFQQAARVLPVPGVDFQRAGKAGCGLATLA